MRRAQDRARSARSRKIGARSATIKSRAVGALKLASEASCAWWECARKAGRFLSYILYIFYIFCWSKWNSNGSTKEFVSFYQRWFSWIRFGWIKQTFRFIQPNFVYFNETSCLISQNCLIMWNIFFLCVLRKFYVKNLLGYIFIVDLAVHFSTWLNYCTQNKIYLIQKTIFG